jgi:hypothetical protein
MEHAVERRYRAFGADVCFVSSAASHLAGFSCIRSSFGNARDLFCIAGRDKDDIAHFIDSYDTGGDKQVTRYLDAAAACSATNGDAAHAKALSAPRQLHLIAKFDFGYIVGVGGRLPTGTLQHGFASFDPELGLSHSGLEYFYALSGSESAAQFFAKKRGHMKTIGGFTLHEDDDNDIKTMNEKFIGQIRKSGIEVKLAAHGGEIEQATAMNRSDAEKNDLISSWIHSITDNLEDEGFESLDDDDLERLTGMGYDDIRRNLASGRPYGLRDDVGATLKDLVLLSGPSDRCPKKRGAMLAMILDIAPIEGERRDFGALNLMVLGIGDCGRPGSASRYIDEVADQSYGEFIRTMEATP